MDLPSKQQTPHLDAQADKIGQKLGQKESGGKEGGGGGGGDLTVRRSRFWTVTSANCVELTLSFVIYVGRGLQG